MNTTSAVSQCADGRKLRAAQVAAAFPRHKLSDRSAAHYATALGAFIRVLGESVKHARVGNRGTWASSVNLRDETATTLKLGGKLLSGILPRKLKDSQYNLF